MDKCKWRLGHFLNWPACWGLNLTKLWRLGFSVPTYKQQWRSGLARVRKIMGSNPAPLPYFLWKEENKRDKLLSGLFWFQDIHLAKRFYDMAAETSADAKVPVALALAKLGVIFAFKNWESVTAFTISPEWKARLELYWDLYLLSMLVGILGILIFIRRPRLRQAARAEGAAAPAAPQWTRLIIISQKTFRTSSCLPSAKWKLFGGALFCWFVIF